MRKGKFGMGFGLGMICGALLLQVLLYAQSLSEETASLAPDNGWTDAADPLAEASWDEQQLYAAAESLDFILYPKKEKLYTESELEEAIQHAVKAESEPQMTRSIVVPNGVTSEEVAELLVQSGLIADKQEWLDMLTQRGLHSRIRAGIYTFEDMPDPLELLEQITD